MTAVALTIGWLLFDPPLGDAARLPSVEFLKAGLEFNRRYQCHLATLAEIFPEHRERIRAALEDAEFLRWNVWDAAWGAHPDYQCSEEAKRAYLRRYRLAVGRDAYYRDGIPPPVPLWHFAELRR